MIAYLKGKIIGKDSKSLILDVNGVGYKISTSQSVLRDADSETPTAFFIHTHVREDEISLFGFPERQELLFFEMLISVSGIGPRGAMSIMDFPINEVKKAICEQNLKWLTKIHGLGKKTAQRLILELKDKIKKEDIEGIEFEKDSAIPEDVIDALIKLGYQRHHIRRVFENAEQKLTHAEEFIKYFLQNM